jgi:hypothetical protein
VNGNDDHVSGNAAAAECCVLAQIGAGQQRVCRRYQIVPPNFIARFETLKNGLTPEAIHSAASASGVVPASTAAITFVCVSR